MADIDSILLTSSGVVESLRASGPGPVCLVRDGRSRRNLARGSNGASGRCTEQGAFLNCQANINMFEVRCARPFPRTLGTAQLHAPSGSNDVPDTRRSNHPGGYHRRGVGQATCRPSLDVCPASRSSAVPPIQRRLCLRASSPGRSPHFDTTAKSLGREGQGEELPRTFPATSARSRSLPWTTCRPCAGLDCVWQATAAPCTRACRADHRPGRPAAPAVPRSSHSRSRRRGRRGRRCRGAAVARPASGSVWPAPPAHDRRPPLNRRFGSRSIGTPATRAPAAPTAPSGSSSRSRRARGSRRWARACSPCRRRVVNLPWRTVAASGPGFRRR